MTRPATAPAEQGRPQPVVARRTPLPQVATLPAVPYLPPRRAVAAEPPSPRVVVPEAEHAPPRVRLLLGALALVAFGTALAERLLG